MSTPAELERNRAVRIAYAHARAGRVDLVSRWLELAGRFAAPTARQLAHAAALERTAGAVIPGQLDINGKEHTP